ncbi:MAG: TetR/AcrR family transcriptional regulator [Alphaproteobacteria bacterium]|nr:TetR/AcrR family transcriptional regulator [Alphaproteobacteria bacterium]
MNGEWKARRKPTQARAIATWDAIVEACAQVLRDEGAAAVSTNRIAEVAGVSIGSLYQYFPNKESVLLALADREVETLRDNLEALLRVSGDLHAEVVVEQVIRGMFAMREQHVLLMRVAQADRDLPDMASRRVAVAESLRDMVRRLLARRKGQVREMDADVVSFVIVHAIQGNLQAIDGGLEPWFLSKDELIDEIVALVVRYVRADPPAG